jgi:2'-5' RNA ligase
MLRTFVAVTITPTLELERLYARLARLVEPARPVPLANLHVTLKFLGETDLSKVAPVASAVAEAAISHSACEARLAGLGAFPDARRPRTVWVGLDGATVLANVAADLEGRLEALGFAREGRAFHPHVTLLRVKSRPPQGLLTLIAQNNATDFGSTPIQAVEFFQSELTPRGSQYNVLARAPLAAG